MGFYFTGLVCFHRGDLKKAVGNFEVFSSKCPEYTPPIIERARNLRDALNDAHRAHDYASSMQHYKRALDLAPKSHSSPSLENDRVRAAILLSRAGYFNQNKKYEQAIQDYAAALELHDGLFEAWQERAMVYKKLGNFEKALQSFHGASQLQPTNTSICFSGISFAFSCSSNFSFHFSSSSFNLPAEVRNSLKEMQAKVNDPRPFYTALVAVFVSPESKVL